MTRTKPVGLDHIASGWGLKLAPDPATAHDDVRILVKVADTDAGDPALYNFPAPIGQDGDIVSDCFEYERLSPKSRAVLQEQEALLDQIERQATIEKGRVLRAIKSAIVAEIGHGNWLAWLAAWQPKIPETTARCWIRAADWVDESAIVADMDLGAIYRGARAPAQVKDEIVRRLKAGDPVDLDRVVGMIKLYKDSTSGAAYSGRARESDLIELDEYASEVQNGMASRSRKCAEEAAKDVVKTLRSFLEDDEIKVLNARWRQATYAEVERLLYR